METKTLHIGEACMGGTLTVKVDEYAVTVEVKRFKTKTILESKTFSDTMSLIMYLGDITTAFYADKMIKFVKEQDVGLRVTSMW